MPDAASHDARVAVTASSSAHAAAPSIRVLAAAFVVIPVVVVSAVLVLLIWGTSRRTAEALATGLTDHAGVMVAENVRSYLGGAVRVSDLYTRRIQDGTLSLGDLESWRKAMLEDVATTPDVASICFGASDGRSVYLQRAHGRLELGIGSGPGPDQCREVQIAPDGTVLGPPLRLYQYDPTGRPWFKAATEAGIPTWTPVYFWFTGQSGDAVTGAGYARPISMPSPPGIAGSAPALAGVLTVDVTISALSDYLKQIPLGDGAHLYITDAQGVLVAATEGGATSSDGARLGLERSSSAAARAIAPVLERTRPVLGSTADAGAPPVLVPTQSHRASLPEGPARVAVTALTPYRGLDWRLITVIPESSFMGDARTALNRSLLVAALAVVGAGVLGLSLSNRLAHPIMALRTHMTRLARGEFDVPLNLRAARELQELSRDINTAARDLKSHVEVKHSLELAMQVQQSLLPAHPPEIPGLDLAGKSTYCDQTGGDYFDFIDVHPVALDGFNGTTPATTGRTGTLVVVGDVMGHGVAAALLMATARATLRLRARQPASLGRILTDVNDVLAPDFRQGRFMTMALLLIDPEARRARWASAGHDAPLVYEPGGRSFRTLEGGDVPLGVLAGTEYRDYDLNALEPGSVLLIGTDGIWEAANQEGEQFGHERLREVVRAQAGKSAAEIAAAIDAALRAFLGPARPKDDVTYAIAKLR